MCACVVVSVPWHDTVGGVHRSALALGIGRRRRTRVVRRGRAAAASGSAETAAQSPIMAPDLGPDRREETPAGSLIIISGNSRVSCSEQVRQDWIRPLRE